MFVKCLNVGKFGTNCYILCDKIENRAAIIDPGFDAPRILTALDEAECRADYVIFTHGHFDHISAAHEVIDATSAKLVVFEKEMALLNNPDENLHNSCMQGRFRTYEPQLLMRDGGTLGLGTLEMRFIHTPGHTVGSCSIICQDSIFTGDTLFRSSAGRTDLPTGSREQLFESLRKLDALEGNYNVFPGHGELTTLDEERENNNFIYMARKGDS